MAVESIFIELSLIIILALVISVIMKLLKQPLIIGYVITGIIAGASFLNLTESYETLAVFSKIGITFLLFLVGLSLNPRVIKEVGKVSLITGLGQVIFTSVVGFLIAKGLGFATLPAVYISLAFTFSSTIIITKLLSDKRDLDTLYGKISIGFLIVQDLVAVLILMALSSYSSDSSVVQLLSSTLIVGLLLVVGVFLVGLYVLPRVTKRVAHSQEYLLLFSVAWAFAVAALFQFFNFSMEMGALLAGIALSLSPYRYEISSKMSPLRDFFVVLFFIWLGGQMIIGNVLDSWIPIVIFSLFILIGNPLIVLVLMGSLGYTKRNSFLCGLTVAQISEFSLILIALGVSVGHLSQDILSFATAVGLITIAGSTYFINYNERLFHKLSGVLGIFERKGKKIDKKVRKGKGYEIILFGYNRIGFNILKSFAKSKKRYLVIDYNPKVIADLSSRGINCMYGDAHDLEILNELNLDDLELAISTIPAVHVNVGLLRELKKKKIPFIATSHTIDDSFELYKAGAMYVIMPHFLGGEHIAHLLEKHKFDPKKLAGEGKNHRKDLNKRGLEGHEHPRKDYFGE